MKLHTPDCWLPCGIAAISILTGKSTERVEKEIINQRKVNPVAMDGRRAGKRSGLQPLNRLDMLFLDEIFKAMRKWGVRMGVYKKARGKNIFDFVKKNPRGLFYMDFIDHATIVKDGLIYDNGAWADHPETWVWRNKKLCGWRKILN